ncbi:MAG: histone H1 [Anaerolineae bacterium]|nr:histone H1 [Anaerolineae bacterium]MCB0225149.1 histone H1 [Anaerolineae bacterium]MCB9108578.1 histone H1 [Anaerolineales bacterium]
MNRYEELVALLDSLKEDFGKFYDGGNKAAGTRIRKGMLDLKNKAQDIRKEVQDIKNQE